MCPDGVCVRSVRECRSSKFCSPEEPFYCIPFQKCAKDHYSCSLNFLINNYCPSFLPFRCPFDNSCRSQRKDCPTAPFCPPNKPFFCSFDLQCKISINDCLPNNITECPKGLIPCSDGSCSPDLCGTPKTCTDDFPIKCIDGSCTKSPEDCFAFDCSLDNQVMCHNTGFCIQDRSFCQQTKICPIYTPIKCPDNECVKYLENCSNQSQLPVDILKKGCLNGKFKCLGGLCVDSLVECPDYIESNECLLVNPETPFPCSDGSCVESHSQCPSLQICEKYQCFSGDCVESQEMCGPRDLDQGCFNKSRKIKLRSILVNLYYHMF